MTTKNHEKIKLHKQWKHWVAKAGLRLESAKYTREWWSYYSLIGKGRRWRANCLGEFQMSEKYETFDRWANSLVSTVALPKTEKEFIEAINKMLREDFGN